jgi:hypothetical protein
VRQLDRADYAVLGFLAGGFIGIVLTILVLALARSGVR